MTATAAELMIEAQGAFLAEQATGCPGAGDYRRWAEAQGYTLCKVYDWTSSAGDWSFLVSKDGTTWYSMWQTNNYPRAGFTREVDTSYAYLGTFEDACQQVADRFE